MGDCYMKRYGSPSIVIDRFNRANGNLGNAESGQAWLTGGSPTTAWVVSSNVAKRATATTAFADVVYIDCGKTDVTISANITKTTSSAGVCLVARMGADFGSSMSLYIDSLGSVAVRRLLGGNTFLGMTTYPFVSGTTYACVFTCKGNDFTVSIDGVVKVSVTDDNALKTNTKIGMFLPCTAVANDYFDNFTVKG